MARRCNIRYVATPALFSSRTLHASRGITTSPIQASLWLTASSSNGICLKRAARPNSSLSDHTTDVWLYARQSVSLRRSPKKLTCVTCAAFSGRTSAVPLGFNLSELWSSYTELSAYEERTTGKWLSCLGYSLCQWSTQKSWSTTIGEAAPTFPVGLRHSVQAPIRITPCPLILESMFVVNFLFLLAACKLQAR